MEITEKKTVTVGIAAYNEEKNIRQILNQIINQKGGNFILEKIIVVSDGSNDSTVKTIQQIKNNLISVKEYSQRKGKPARTNELMQMASSDILILIDADVKIANQFLIRDLVIPLKQKNIYLASGVAIPLKPETTVEHIVATGICLWNEAKTAKNMSMMYKCEGQIRALKKELYTELKFPLASADDVYPFLYCQKKKYGFAAVDSAIVYFRLPQTFKDYRKQMNRYLVSYHIQKENFGNEITKKFYTVNLSTKIYIVAKNIFKDPFWVSLYLLFLTIPKFLSLFKIGDKKSNWNIIKTTKNIKTKYRQSLS
jgi:glycosyltransferase involved in cell wall biosynthesis